MADTLVDSSVLLDITQEGSEWHGWSKGTLAKCWIDGSLLINPLIYAEISVGFFTEGELEASLADVKLQRANLPYGAAFRAGKCFQAYRRRGGTKTSPMPDFYIGAHAEICHLRLLTRDPTRYRTYFPTLEIISPER